MKPGTKTKILIVEDKAMLRDSLESVIGQQADMEVAGVTDDAAEAPELCQELKPSLVLMDVVTKNDSSGIIFAAQILNEMPDTKIVIMTEWPDITYEDEAKKAGVHSFIYKDMGKEELFHVIRNTMNNHGTYPGPSNRFRFVKDFTEREKAVLRLGCRGETREEMAKELGISEGLLNQIIRSILDKSGWDSFAKFCIYAAGKDLIVTGKNPENG